MSKREKIKFEDLEKLGQGAPKPFTEGEIVSILRDEAQLGKVLATRKLEFFATLFRSMAMSTEFRNNVINIINRKNDEENKHK